MMHRTALGLLVAAASAFAQHASAAANSAPSTSDVNLDTEEDSTVTATLKATDPDGDTLVFRLAKPPKNGEATLSSSGQLQYTPNADFHGKDELTFEVNDGRARVTRKAHIAISSVNDRPTAAAVELTGVEDKPVVGQVIGRDADKDPLAFAVIQAPARGHADVDARTGRFTFVPEHNDTGRFTFTIKMTDGTVDVDVPVSVTLAPVNDGPSATDDKVSTKEDVPLKGKLVGSDPDQDALTFAITAAPAHGAITVEASTGKYAYTPSHDYAGEDAFAFSVNDGKLSAKARVAITVQNVNDPPTVSGLALEGGEDQPVVGKIVAKDLDGDAIAYRVTGDAKHGEAEVDSESGQVTYLPVADFAGTDSFVVEASDLAGGVNVNVTVTIKPVNDAPEAVSDAVKGDEDQPITGKLRATDVDKDALRFALTKPPKSGTVDVKADGAFRYEPKRNFNGDDAFSWEVSDGNAKAQGRMELEVRPQNDAPQTGDVAVKGNEDSMVNGRVVGTDIDKDPLEYSVGKQGKHGQATVDERAGTFSYQPAADENGDDQFMVIVSDGRAQAQATVRVTLAPVNDAPVAQPQQGAADEDHPVQGDVLASDVDQDPLTYRVVGKPRLGAVTLDEKSGTWVYTPRLNENGADSFRFEVSDGKLRSAADVKLTLSAVNDAPDTKDVALTTSEDQPTVGTVAASDVDRDKLTWSLGLAPKKGALAVDAAGGRITYTPTANENGQDRCVVEVSDGTTKSSANVTIEIAPVNDAPVADAGAATGFEDQPVRGALVAHDVDKDALTYQVVTAPRRGSVQVDASTGEFVYSPRQDENGDDGFRFEVSDGALRASADIKLSVAAVNDAPVPKDVALSAIEDREAGGKVMARDVDKDVLTYRLSAPPARGVALVDDATGSFRYLPLRDQHGADRLVIAVTDGVATANATVTVEVAAAPDAPVVDPLGIETAEDEPVTVQLSAVDPDNEPTTFIIVTQAQLGAAELQADGRTVRFTPRPDAHGEDRLVVEAQDGKNRVRAVLPVRVAARNDAPTIDAASAETPEETPVLVALVAHDKDGDAVQLTLDDKPPAGVSLSGRLLRVQPPRDFVGTIEVKVTPSDPTGKGAPLLVPIKVVNVNDAPEAKDVALNATPGTAVAGVVTATDADTGDELSFTVAVPPRQGTVTLDDAHAGRFTYTAAAGARGEDSFRIRVRDKAGASVTATVRVTPTVPAKPALKPARP